MRKTAMTRSALFLGAALSLALPAAALAHHGWGWVSPDKFELTGSITQIYLGNPHAILGVHNSQGDWIVELAPAPQTERAGFVKGIAKVGDMVTATGNRSGTPTELRMKAVKVQVGGKDYLVYPDRQFSS